AGAAEGRGQGSLGREGPATVGADRDHHFVAVIVAVANRRGAHRAFRVAGRVARRRAALEGMDPDSAPGVDGQLATMVGNALRGSEYRDGRLGNPVSRTVGPPPLEGHL